MLSVSFKNKVEAHFRIFKVRTDADPLSLHRWFKFSLQVIVRSLLNLLVSNNFKLRKAQFLAKQPEFTPVKRGEDICSSELIENHRIELLVDC